MFTVSGEPLLLLRPTQKVVYSVTTVTHFDPYLAVSHIKFNDFMANFWPNGILRHRRLQEEVADGMLSTEGSWNFNDIMANFWPNGILRRRRFQE